MSKDDNVVTLSGAPLLTPAKCAEKIKTFDKVLAVGELDGETHLVCSDGYNSHELIFRLENILWLMKMELFGLPELVDDE